MRNRAVFLDRDGTMAPDNGYCDSVEKFALFSYTAEAVRLLSESGFKIVVVTNQSGIGRGYFTEETLAEIHNRMIELLARDSAYLDAIYYCPHRPDENCACRKPRAGLILRAVEELNIDLSRSFMIGDHKMDIELARSVGCKVASVGECTGEENYCADNLVDAAVWITLEALHGK